MGGISTGNDLIFRFVVKPTSSINILQKTIVQFSVNNLKPGEILGIGFKRLGSDALDTYTGGVAVINLRTIGYFWRP